MTRDAMEHAIASLQAQGLACSVQNLRRTLGGGSLRDIVRLRNAVLLRATTDRGFVLQRETSKVSMCNEQPVLAAKPLALCYRCSGNQWHERVRGDFVCATCGVPPAT
jgi:hypothetical protein